LGSTQIEVKAKKYAKGMGKAVADRTINRKLLKKFKKPKTMRIDIDMTGYTDIDSAVKTWTKQNDYELGKYVLEGRPNGVAHVKVTLTGVFEIEEWEDVAERVAEGNVGLIEGKAPQSELDFEFNKLHYHLRKANILMSGRHLQHGDKDQSTRNLEVFTNCSTSQASFITFYLLLNGSGVGRAYDDNMMVVDWSHLPIVVTVVDSSHADVQSGELKCMSLQTAKHLYANKKQHYFRVPDTREGWAKAIEIMEIMAYDADKRDDVLLLDFSDVRPRGAPIKGMQNRPASGPGPLIVAINNVSLIRDAGMQPWRQAMYVDHYLAECVLVGGARRAARMSTKTWRDTSVLDFIEIKRGGFLWSSNNSVTVDAEFWKYVKYDEEDELLAGMNELVGHAQRVLDRIAYCSYHDGTGEPGIINQDKLVNNEAGLTGYGTGDFVGSKKYQLEIRTKDMMRNLCAHTKMSRYKMITNPCGEIALLMLGGYCVIADVVPYHADGLKEAEDAFRAATRALIRTNTMDSLYKTEVQRTNRIGVGITGLHEFAWKFFGYGWKDLVDEKKSQPFWKALNRFKQAVVDEAKTYSAVIGLPAPHTNTTIKPAGTTSKLFGLTEGAHLPSMLEYLRWVQFRNDDPLVAYYRTLGYPVKELKVYNGTTIVGFPTQPEICKLGMGDKLVTAAQATPEEQYEYLRLLEKYWIKGLEEGDDTGNQVSYTLKYDPKKVSFEQFKKTLIEYQSGIKCCSVMPQTDVENYAYEYLPEHPLTKHEYEQVLNAINDDEIKEDVGLEHIDCSTGACPITFNENSAAQASV
jgi:hypothetical protein